MVVTSITLSDTLEGVIVLDISKGSWEVLGIAEVSFIQVPVE